MILMTLLVRQEKSLVLILLKQTKNFILTLHNTGKNSYLFVNGNDTFKFKAINNDPRQFSLESISKKFDYVESEDFL